MTTMATSHRTAVSPHARTRSAAAPRRILPGIPQRPHALAPGASSYRDQVALPTGSAPLATRWRHPR